MIFCVVKQFMMTCERVQVQVGYPLLKLYQFLLSMQDNCVYARNLLGRLVSTYGSTSTQQYSQSQTSSQDSTLNPGLLMFVGAIVVLLFFMLRNRKKEGQSKIE